MKTVLKRVVRSSVGVALAAMDSNRLGRFIEEECIAAIMARRQQVRHGGITLTFAVPNGLNRFRAETFAVKEPETLAWIERIPDGSVLWDIGANVGLYTCFAAKARRCRVFAFEPSVFNLEMLARNIHLNELAPLVTIVPLPLSDRLGMSTLNMTTTEWGGALSTFGAEFGFDGRPLNKSFDFPTIGLSMMDAVHRLGVPPPNYIKMDVDGAEHLILSGGADVLKHVDGVLVEINDAFHEHAHRATRCLTDAGLTFVERRKWEGIQGDGFDDTFNQIWARRAGTAGRPE